MVQLITNARSFFNDMTEEVRLFMGQTDILPYAPEAELRLYVILCEGEAKCLAMPQHVEKIVTVQAGTDALDVKRQQKRALKLCVYQVMQTLYPVATPWGSLTGIRPTKLFREIAGRQGEEEAKRSFRELFTVSSDKQALVEEITDIQRPYIESVAPRSASVYLHIPFCRSRCLYCSFGAEVARKEGVLSEYADHLILDIQKGAELLLETGFQIRTFYFGGGTPTVLSASDLDRILAALDAAYNRNEECAKRIDEMAALHEADPEGYVYEGHIVEGKPHWMDLADAAAVPWMAKYHRNPAPGKIVWVQGDEMKSAFYWLGVPMSQAAKGRKIEARIDGNTVEILSSDYTAATIYLNDKMMDLDKPVRVVFGDKVLFEGPVTRKPDVMRQTLRERGDLSYVFPVRVDVNL